MTQATNKLSSIPTAVNTIVCGRARMVMLTDRLVRLEWAEYGQFEDRASLAQERRRLNRLLPALAAMLPRLGSGVSDWEPGINPQRAAVCEKASAVLKATLVELRKS
ncbi:MAG: hypothetical protein ACOYOU_16680 [Kiritimatiellia bacterium]